MKKKILFVLCTTTSRGAERINSICDKNFYQEKFKNSSLIDCMQKIMTFCVNGKLKFHFLN